MGILVEGAENATRVRKVMVISVLFAILIITNSILQQVEDKSDPIQKAMSLMLPLLVPACGYMGAKRGDRACLGCFWGCNAFSAVCNTMTVGMWILMITLYADDVTEAHQACYGDYCDVDSDHGNYRTCIQHEACQGLEGIVVNQTRCVYQGPRAGVVIQRQAPLVGGRTCPEIKRSYEMLTKEKWDLRLMVVLGVFTVILNTCACWHGKHLYDENVFTSSGYNNRPMANMTPIHVQVWAVKTHRVARNAAFASRMCSHTSLLKAFLWFSRQPAPVHAVAVPVEVARPDFTETTPTAVPLPLGAMAVGDQLLQGGTTVRNCRAATACIPSTLVAAAW